MNLTTERLEIREFSEADAPFVLELLNSPTWIKFIGNRNIRTLEDAKLRIQNVFSPNYDKGLGAWQITRKEDQTPVGLSCILKRDELELPDIGYALLPQFEGLGYALEATKAVANYAKNTLQIPYITAFTTEENVRSMRLMEKLGLKYQKTIQLGDDPTPLLYYSDEP